MDQKDEKYSLRNFSENQQLQNYEAFIHSIDGIVWEAEAQTHRFLFVSMQAERILGYPVLSWIKSPTFWKDHLHKDDRKWAVDYCAKAIKEKKNHRFECRMIAADGCTVWLRNNVSVIVNNDQPVKLQGVMVDITKIKRMQQQLIHMEKLSSIGTFLSSIAHELSNPLTTLLSFSESLVNEKNKNLPQNVINDLKVIINQAKRAAEIVRNLQKFSRKTVSKKTIDSINNIIEETLSAQASLCRPENIEIKKELAESPLLVFCDKTQLQQVFLNIIINACNAMKGCQKKGILKVRTQKTGQEACIIFENNGPPIPERIFNKIFDPFFTSGQCGDGTGLGLYVSIGIIQDHRGKIWAENIKDKGVRFVITLPITHEDIKTAKTKSKEPTKLENLKVLLVDDEEGILKSLKRFLAIHNISVLTAKNGIDAIKLLEQNEFDVIISDIKMPYMNGLELGIWLETMKPGYIEKFVLFTGVIDKEADDFCSKHHYKYLLKPVDNNTILETIFSIARN